MKRFTFLFTILLLGFSKPSMAKSTFHGERNMGGCVGYYWCSSFFPGFSVVKVETISNGQAFAEFQYGLAFPTIFTTKIVGGFETGRVKLSMGFRVYPLAVGPQIQIQTGKKKAITLSVEHCQGYGGEPIGIIMTLGFRGKK